MKNIFGILFIYITVLLSVCGCGSENTQTRTSISSDSLANLLTGPSQFFCINSNKDTTVVGKEGTSILIPKGSLCLENGDSVNAPIIIELKEFYKISEMVSSKLSTLSGRDILETGGMIYLNAKANNANVKIKEGYKFSIEMPTKKKEGMEIFYGVQNNAGNINWGNNSLNNNTISEGGFPDTIAYSENNHLHNALRAINLGWINCDKFLKLDNTIDLLVELKNAPDTNMFCSVVMKKHNSIIPSMITETNAKFSPVPVNEAIYIVAVGYSDGKYYLGFKEVTTEKGVKYEVEIKETSKEELLTRLQALDQNRDLVAL